MASHSFKGLGVALITPFNVQGAIDFDALGKLLDYQIGNGIDFLVILATTGETPTLSAEERDSIRKFVVEKVAGRLPIVMGCGGNHTAAVVHELQTADFTGVDAILSVCPFYNKPAQEGLYQHFKAVTEASPLPVIIYNVPGRTGVNIQAATTLRLANDCPNIIAIKEASGSLEQVDAILNGKPEGFDVISGDDSLTYEMMASGAAGVISVLGNALPKEFATMIHLEMQGDYAAASKLHHSFSELYKLLFVDGNPSGVKALLAEMGLIQNFLRLPLVPARAETAKRMMQIANELLIKPSFPN